MIMNKSWYKTIFDMNAVTLSIVMPVFNRVDLVKQMVDSILQNSFQQWELWAVDDGSSEENVNILSDYFSVDSRIHYIKRNLEPKGAQTCRNIGLEKAQGKYIIFLDSDDRILPSCLETRVEALNNRDDLDFMVFPSGVIVNDEYSSSKHLKYSYGFPIFRDDYDAFARRVLPFVVWNNIYRTQSLRSAKISWDTRLLSLQDADFNLQTMFAGLKYDYSSCPPDIGYRIDASAGSVSKKINSVEHRASIIYAITKFYKMYQSCYGHKYDRALYNGVLHLYNHIMTDKFVGVFADEMCASVYTYSKFYGSLFKVQILATKALRLFLPDKLARQIPMACHLIGYVARMKKKQKDIRKIVVV